MKKIYTLISWLYYVLLIANLNEFLFLQHFAVINNFDE